MLLNLINMTTTIIPQLPKSIIERILNEAELPLYTRLYFIDYGYYLLPNEVCLNKKALEVEEDLYYIFHQRLVNKAFPDNRTYYQLHASFTDYEFEINIYEVEDIIYYKFEAIYIDYETGDIITKRSTVSNYLTGEIINPVSLD